MRLNDATKALLLASLAIGACGGKAVEPSHGLDSGLGQDAGTGGDAGTGEDARADHEAGATMRSEDAEVADVAAPDGAVVVPENHRADDAQCQAPRPAGSCASAGLGPGLLCASDRDCTDGGAAGRCLVNGGGPAGCHCSYDDCHADADCGADAICACHGSPYFGGGNRCMPTTTCRVDADCGAGGYCSPSQGPNSCFSLVGYYCHTPNDACTNDSDCYSGGQTCMWSPDNRRWECTSTKGFACPL
jgi:hypothetical protein